MFQLLGQGQGHSLSHSPGAAAPAEVLLELSPTSVDAILGRSQLK